jgi:molybdopterin-guanine dinucleotide biosynthesis protein A
VIAPADLTLGLLAGGRARRLGGLDKAWLQRDGVPQVVRLARRFSDEAGHVLVSANRELERYGEYGLATVSDRTPDAGPMGGLDALLQACTTPWLLTLPVDLHTVSDDLLRSLAAASARGAWAEDEDGPQPLVALWRVDLVRDALVHAIAQRDFAVHALQARLGMACVRLAGVRFGNLNTPADLAAAGFSSP